MVRENKKIKEVRTTKEAMIDLGSQLDAVTTSLDCSEEELEHMINYWSEKAQDIFGSEDTEENEASIIFSFAAMGAKTALVYNLGASFCLVHSDENKVS